MRLIFQSLSLILGLSLCLSAKADMGISIEVDTYSDAIPALSSQGDSALVERAFFEFKVDCTGWSDLHGTGTDCNDDDVESIVNVAPDGSFIIPEVDEWSIEGAIFEVEIRLYVVFKGQEVETLIAVGIDGDELFFNNDPEPYQYTSLATSRSDRRRYSQYFTFLKENIESFVTH